MIKIMWLLIIVIIFGIVLGNWTYHHFLFTTLWEQYYYFHLTDEEIIGWIIQITLKLESELGTYIYHKTSNLCNHFIIPYTLKSYKKTNVHYLFQQQES